MPLLNVLGPQPLQLVSPEVRNDLSLGELSIALERLWCLRVRGVKPQLDVLPDGGFGRIGEGAIICGRE
jgi:hypothetical protein